MPLDERIKSYDRLFIGQVAEDGGPAQLLPRPGLLRRVLVVGSGVAGLQTCRAMRRLGLEVLVLEQAEDIGGVWQRNYSGFGLQVPWRLYQFPEFPWPKASRPTSEYPTGEEVHAYVRAYAEHFNLLQHVRLNCKLLRLRWSAQGRTWDALYCDIAQEKFFKVTVDYVVICAGIYSQPYIPAYEGSTSYAGVQLHARDFTDLSLARGRRVVVVGAGKTALDCVTNVVAAKTATSVTLLYRQAHWPVPRTLLGTSIRYLLFNRAMLGMLPPYYTAGGAGQAVGRALTPLRKLFWKGLEALITRRFRITEQMRPRVSLPTDLFYGGQILDDGLDKLIRSGAATTVRGEINRFVRNGVILQDQSFVAADLVLYCTGYLKSYEYLEGDMRARLDLQKDGMYLYRNVLPYAVPQLAFVGSEVSTYNNILTSGLQAAWLAGVLAGRVQLPHPTAMVEDVRAQQRWRRGVMPPQRNRGSVLMLYMMQYHDQLVEDMGLRPQRKGLNLVAECFAAYSAHDYTDVVAKDLAAASPIEERETAAAELAAAGVPAEVLAAAVGKRAGAVVAAAAAAAPPPGRAAGAGAPADEAAEVTVELLPEEGEQGDGQSPTAARTAGGRGVSASPSLRRSSQEGLGLASAVAAAAGWVAGHISGGGGGGMPSSYTSPPSAHPPFAHLPSLRRPATLTGVGSPTAAAVAVAASPHATPRSPLAAPAPCSGGGAQWEQPVGALGHAASGRARSSSRSAGGRFSLDEGTGPPTRQQLQLLHHHQQQAAFYAANPHLHLQQQQQVHPGYSPPHSPRGAPLHRGTLPLQAPPRRSHDYTRSQSRSVPLQKLTLPASAVPAAAANGGSLCSLSYDEEGAEAEAHQELEGDGSPFARSPASVPALMPGRPGGPAGAALRGLPAGPPGSSCSFNSASHSGTPSPHHSASGSARTYSSGTAAAGGGVAATSTCQELAPAAPVQVVGPGLQGSGSQSAWALVPPSPSRLSKGTGPRSPLPSRDSSSTQTPRTAPHAHAPIHMPSSRSCAPGAGGHGEGGEGGWHSGACSGGSRSGGVPGSLRRHATASGVAGASGPGSASSNLAVDCVGPVGHWGSGAVSPVGGNGSGHPHAKHVSFVHQSRAPQQQQHMMLPPRCPHPDAGGHGWLGGGPADAIGGSAGRMAGGAAHSGGTASPCSADAAFGAFPSPGHHLQPHLLDSAGSAPSSGAKARAVARYSAAGVEGQRCGSDPVYLSHGVAALGQGAGPHEMPGGGRGPDDTAACGDGGEVGYLQTSDCSRQPTAAGAVAGGPGRASGMGSGTAAGATLATGSSLSANTVSCSNRTSIDSQRSNGSSGWGAGAANGSGAGGGTGVRATGSAGGAQGAEAGGDGSGRSSAPGERTKESGVWRAGAQGKSGGAASGAPSHSGVDGARYVPYRLQHLNQPTSPAVEGEHHESPYSTLAAPWGQGGASQPPRARTGAGNSGSHAGVAGATASPAAHTDRFAFGSVVSMMEGGRVGTELAQGSPAAAEASADVLAAQRPHPQPPHSLHAVGAAVAGRSRMMAEFKSVPEGDAEGTSSCDAAPGNRTLPVPAVAPGQGPAAASAGAPGWADARAATADQLRQLNSGHGGSARDGGGGALREQQLPMYDSSGRQQMVRLHMTEAELAGGAGAVEESGLLTHGSLPAPPVHVLREQGPQQHGSGHLAAGSWAAEHGGAAAAAPRTGGASPLAVAVSARQLRWSPDQHPQRNGAAAAAAGSLTSGGSSQANGAAACSSSSLPAVPSGALQSSALSLAAGLGRVSTGGTGSGAMTASGMVLTASSLTLATAANMFALQGAPSRSVSQLSNAPESVGANCTLEGWARGSRGGRVLAAGGCSTSEALSSAEMGGALLEACGGEVPALCSSGGRDGV